MSNPLCTPQDHLLSRRRFFGLGAGAVAAGAFGGLLSARAGEELKKKDKQVLFVWLDGGMSQMESWDPKPNTPFGGPFRTIPTNVTGVHFSELMPRCARQMDKLCVVRSVSTKDNAHSSGIERIQRGDPKTRGVPYPYFGSAVAKLLGPGESHLPPYVWIKPGSGGFRPDDAGFLGPKFGSLAFGDGLPPDDLLRNPILTPDEDDARNELRAKMNERFVARRITNYTEANSHVFDTARELMKRADIFDQTKTSEKDQERYGKHDLGKHMLCARKMLEAGVRFVKVTSYGWDTHGDNFNAHASLMPKFDSAFSSILEDLTATGQIEHTLVIAMSEFGRTPQVNGHAGRDHWPEAWSIAMAGCGIKKGVVVGETNDFGTDVKSTPYDIGALFHTWFSALGIDSIREEYDNKGQPLPIAHEDMTAIKEALA